MSEPQFLPLPSSAAEGERERGGGGGRGEAKSCLERRSKGVRFFETWARYGFKGLNNVYTTHAEIERRADELTFAPRLKKLC